MPLQPPVTLLVTGFGAFEAVEENPSGAVARALDGATLHGARVVGVELPVTFAGSGPALDAALDSLGAAPLCVLSLGVHRGPTFRLEARAGTALLPGRPDTAGETAEAAGLSPAPDLETGFDLERLQRVLEEAGAPATEISRDAGGYVCERVYRHVLEYGERSGVPGLFLHLPPLASEPLAVQLDVVRRLVGELARSSARQVEEQ